MGKPMNILVVVAHPDDEVLGCGGTMARLVKEGNKVSVLILSEGIKSRDNWKKGDLLNMEKQIVEANKVLGIDENNIFILQFPDNQFDTVPFLNIVKEIERIKKEVNPEIIFTHSKSDLNIDHRITFQAVLTATRPMEKETVKTIYSFEILSCTEWNFETDFSPNVFFDVTDTIYEKEKALEKYETEIRVHPHPRSVAGIYILSAWRGITVGTGRSEAFELIRDIKD